MVVHYQGGGNGGAQSRACFVDEIQSPEVNLTEFDRSQGCVFLHRNILYSKRNNIYIKSLRRKYDRF